MEKYIFLFLPRPILTFVIFIGPLIFFLLFKIFNTLLRKLFEKLYRLRFKTKNWKEEGREGEEKDEIKLQ